jgi:hypothetical protein
MLKFAKEDLKLFLASMTIVIFGFSGIYIVYADTKTATLTATVTASLTLTVTTDVFGSIAAGASSPKYATSTLNVNTNNVNGWNVTLYGNNTGSLAASTTMYLSPTTYATNFTDQTQWIPGSATTSAGNAVRSASLINSQNVLAFRVMSASSTNGASFWSTTWWGSADNYVDNATTLWAGIASSTVQRQIGNAGIGSYSASDHINTVLYYVKTASTQGAGSYTGDLTYTATANP